MSLLGSVASLSLRSFSSLKPGSSAHSLVRCPHAISPPPTSNSINRLTADTLEKQNTEILSPNFETKQKNESAVYRFDDVFSLAEKQKLQTLKALQNQRKAVIYTERQQVELAKTYYDQFAKNAQIKREKKLNIVMGLPGAGKSSVIAQSIQQRGEGALLIEADEIKKLMPEYEGGKGSLAVRSAAACIAERCLNDALKNGDNIIYTTVGDTAPELEKLITKAKGKGYSVKLHLAQVSPDKAARRVYDRMAHAVDHPEAAFHYVSPSLPLQIGDTPKNNFDYLKKLVDESRIWATEALGDTRLNAQKVGSNKPFQWRKNNLGLID
jgi:predicted kinase